MKKIVGYILLIAMVIAMLPSLETKASDSGSTVYYAEFPDGFNKSDPLYAKYGGKNVSTKNVASKTVCGYVYYHYSYGVSAPYNRLVAYKDEWENGRHYQYFTAFYSEKDYSHYDTSGIYGGSDIYYCNLGDTKSHSYWWYRTAVYKITYKETTYKISNDSLTCYVGLPVTLKVTSSDGSKVNVEWSTSNKSKATVSNTGVVTPKKKGEVTITAKINDKTSLKCKIKISNLSSSNNNKSFEKKMYATGDISIKGIYYSIGSDLEAVKKGSEVKVIGSLNNSYGNTWFKIKRSDNTTGYIYSGDLTEEKPSMSNFVPRTNAPESTNKYYINYAYGGLSSAIVINSSNGSVLPNCVGYVNARAHEVLKASTINWSIPACNAEDFIDAAKNNGLATGTTPKLGAIIVWSQGSKHNWSDGCGHVAIVEKINSDGSIECSESSYGGKAFELITYTATNNYYQGSGYKFEGFIYLPGIE